MDSLSKIGCLTFYRTVQLPRIPVRSASFSRSSSLVSVSRAGPSSVSDVDEDVLQIFFKERESNGDFISRASDLLWQRKFRSSIDSNSSEQTNNSQETEQLSRTQEWILGDNTAPMNKKAVAKALQESSERRKKLNILQYESLKREILLLSLGIGVACSGYCLVTLSVQAAVSYAIGVLCSCLYLQLLYRHADNLSSEDVPQIFMKKKSKKIGIRSEDLQDSLERSIKGIGISLSSPRLVIPAAIFGLWVLSHQYIADDFFDFQIVPAIFGMLVYKAAVLVQVYRDNEDLQFVFPENKEGSSD
ncbi:uncharacterized protein LOC114712401 isoform X2 [Neltuma alba]|uniref:uncharacterized protein LOC114712401 isoform X2 n=1 Tax=Neltuma alba TaxID=207710 RepID=UPI0010A460A3|nr:uncharacterized protein LOC114712401 isoform X2 [Prosopis alba]